MIKQETIFRDTMSFICKSGPQFQLRRGRGRRGRLEKREVGEGGGWRRGRGGGGWDNVCKKKRWPLTRPKQGSTHSQHQSDFRQKFLQYIYYRKRDFTHDALIIIKKRRKKAAG